MYKRQGDTLWQETMALTAPVSEISPFRTRPLATLSSTTSAKRTATGTPVSYTHLDVYKRQVLNMSIPNNFIDATLDRSLWMPISVAFPFRYCTRKNESLSIYLSLIHIFRFTGCTAAVHGAGGDLGRAAVCAGTAAPHCKAGVLGLSLIHI